MPASKKGRISGAKRASIAATRANKILSGEKGIIFARVVKHEGMGHVAALIDSKKGPVDVKVQIPPVFSRKGSTPINSTSVIAIYVGEGFDATKFDVSTHFRVETIMSEQQAYDLAADGLIPEWMIRNEKKGDATAGDGDTGFDFDRSGTKEGEEEEEEEEEKEEKEKSDTSKTKVAETIDTTDTGLVDPEFAAEAEYRGGNHIVYDKVAAKREALDFEFNFE